MPIYEFVCTDCHSRFEDLMTFSESGLEVLCPSCQKPAKKAISLFASFTKAEDGSTAALGGGCPACGGGACSCHG